MKRLDVLVVEYFQTILDDGEIKYARRLSNQQWEMYDMGAWYPIPKEDKLYVYLEKNRDVFTEATGNSMIYKERH
jgi:hypothetical protein